MRKSFNGLNHFIADEEGKEYVDEPLCEQFFKFFISILILQGEIDIYYGIYLSNDDQNYGRPEEGQDK